VAPDRAWESVGEWLPERGRVAGASVRCHSRSLPQAQAQQVQQAGYMPQKHGRVAGARGKRNGSRTCLVQTFGRAGTNRGRDRCRRSHSSLGTSRLTCVRQPGCACGRRVCPVADARWLTRVSGAGAAAAGWVHPAEAGQPAEPALPAAERQPGPAAGPRLLPAAAAAAGFLLLLYYSDTKVYEPQIRARLGTAAHFSQSQQKQRFLQQNALLQQQGRAAFQLQQHQQVCSLVAALELTGVVTV